MNQETAEAIWYYYVVLKLFLQEVDLVLPKLLTAYGKGPHPGSSLSAEINFHGTEFEITLSSGTEPSHLKVLNNFFH